MIIRDLKQGEQGLGGGISEWESNMTLRGSGIGDQSRLSLVRIGLSFGINFKAMRKKWSCN